MEHLQKVAPRDPPLEDSLTVVGQLHGHFYNKHMSEAQQYRGHDGIYPIQLHLTGLVRT